MAPSDGGTGFPDLLAPVTLRLPLPDGGSVEVPSRVGDIEEVDGTKRVVVLRPDLEGVSDAGTFPRRGEELTVVWTRSGQMQLRVTAEAASRPYGIVWVLTPVGETTRDQRRQFFRVPVNLPATLTRVIDEADAADPEAGDVEEAPVRAAVREISEGGAVFTCDSGLPEVGTIVRLSFTLDDKAITAESEVLRHDALPIGRPSAAVRFLDPRPFGDHIRRFGFAVQRAQARLR